jgi:hypothetical protein
MVILSDSFKALEFDEEMRVQGFDYAEVIDLDHLRIDRGGDGSTRVVMHPDIRAWVETECAGEALLATERDDFIIVFNDPTDATMYRLRFA